MVAACRDGGPAWGAAYTILLSYVTRYFADVDTLRRFWPGVVEYLDSLEKMANGGLLTASTYGDWCNIDHGMPQTLPSVKSCAIDSPHLSQCGCNPPPNARKRPIVSAFYYIEQLEMAADMAAVLGLHADVQKYTQLAKDMRAAFVKQFVHHSSASDSNASSITGSDPLVGEGFQTDFALALFSGLIPAGPVRTAVEAALINDVMQVLLTSW